MSERPAIRLHGVGKRYTLYPSHLDEACDALGLGWLVGRRRKRWRQFWALRNVDLTLPRGARIGIVGRNGAGKSTLLKLITGNVAPTEGTVEVHGEVQALLQAGTGMHPEFTGRENIEAALTYQGLAGAAVADAVADIIDFTELGPFLDQPFKTYSTGMQARLAFAAATVLKPDILIVDELLGVGDGYFVSKSSERMRKLIDTGASVLLVTHAMEQIVRFCDRAIWIDRGQIVREGDALETVKEYERYLRLLDERRLRARNARHADPGAAGDATASTQPFTDELVLHFHVAGNARLQVGEIVLLENDRQQDRLHVGGPQDGAPGQSARLRLDTPNGWSGPERRDQRMYRELAGCDAGAAGEAVFSLYLFDPSVAYGFDLDYGLDGGRAVLSVIHRGTILQSLELAPGNSWQRAQVRCTADDACRTATTVKVMHTPGLGGLRIDAVRLLGHDGIEAAQFEFGTPLTFEIRVRAESDGVFPLQPAVNIYRRSDGVHVTQQLGPRETWTLCAGDRLTARMHLGPLQFGNDSYVVSVGLFRKRDPLQVDAAERYDGLDRSLEFRVHGREPYRRGIFQHPGDWEVTRDAPPEARPARSAG